MRGNLLSGGNSSCTHIRQGDLESWVHDALMRHGERKHPTCQFVGGRLSPRVRVQLFAPSVLFVGYRRRKVLVESFDFPLILSAGL